MGGAFTFEKCERNEYFVRCYFFDNKKAEKKDIISILIAQGAKIIPHKMNPLPKVIYFIRKRNLGEFEIDTDLTSMISQYRKRKKMHKILGTMFLPICIFYLLFGNAHDNNFISLCGSVGLIISIPLYLPVFKYNKIIKRLEEERNIHE